MNKKTNSNINITLSFIYGLAILRKDINKVINDISVENIIQRYKEIELESKKNITSKKANTNLQTTIEFSDMIINSNKSQLNLLNKNQFNLNFSKSENYNQ